MTYLFSGTVQDQSTSPTLNMDYHVNGDGSSAVVQGSIFGQQYGDSGSSQIGIDHVGTISVTQQ